MVLNALRKVPCRLFLIVLRRITSYHITIFDCWMPGNIDLNIVFQTLISGCASALPAFDDTPLIESTLLVSRLFFSRVVCCRTAGPVAIVESLSFD